MNYIIIVTIVVVLIIIVCNSNSSNENFETSLKPADKLKLLEVLLMFHEAFEKHDIWYVIAYGTLLGAVRHRTLIPWDDDADVLVKLSDIKKVEVALADLEKHGFKIEKLWKLYRVYGKDTTNVWIDIFFYSEINGKVVRCSTDDKSMCEYSEDKNDWWWIGFDFDSKLLNGRKRYEYSGLSLWGPVNSWQLLKLWYGDDFLIKCKTHDLDHKTGLYVEPKIIQCPSTLPIPQL